MRRVEDQQTHEERRCNIRVEKRRDEIGNREF
jgi:hypothetical protein